MQVYRRRISRAERWLVRAIAAAWLLLAFGVPTAGAQAPPDPAVAVVAGQRQLAAIQTEVSTATDDRRLAQLRDQVAAVQTSAEAASTALQPRLTGVDTRLGQLGPAPRDARSESPDIRLERQALNRSHAQIDGQIKQARLLSVAAQQEADSVAERRRALFNQRIFRPGDSPLSPQLWRVLAGSLPSDLARIRHATVEEAAYARRAASPAGLLILAAGVVAALILLLPVRLWLEALGRRWAATDAPSTRLRRSGAAMWTLLIGTVVPGLAATVVLHALNWSSALSPQGEHLGVAIAVIAVWIGFVTSLGVALLSPGRRTWRLTGLSDETVRRARPYPLLIGAVSGAGLLLERLNTVVGASLAATVSTNALITVVYAAVALGALVAVGRARAKPDEQHDSVSAARTSAWSLVALAIGLAVTVSVIAMLAGYTAFSAFVVRQAVWISVLGGFIFLLVRFVDDLFTQLFCPTGRMGRVIYLLFALKPSTVDQLGVLLSAAVRIGVLLFGISAVLAPFGTGANALAGQIRGLASGVKVGGVLISPVAVLSALAAFAIGVALVRGVQRWLNAEYLPRTGWDPGVRTSVSTAVGYLGVGLAAAWALASMGLGLQRVALIASALSVGIGFGLQQIVQNFISGVIMLIERPVKAGDWVVVGGVEGDIQRINVRATEILMPDRSTVLLPNSEFITKAVQNKTRGDPVGRIQIQFGVAPEADMDEVRSVLQAAYAANPDVLEDPAPSIFIDAVTPVGVQLNTFSYVNSPRSVYPVRSALFFDILHRLRASGVELAGTQQTLRITSTPGVPPPFGPGEQPAVDPLQGGRPSSG